MSPATSTQRLLIPALLAFWTTGCFLDRSPAPGPANPRRDAGADAQVPLPDGGPDLDGGPVLDGGPDGGPDLDGGPNLDGGPVLDGGPGPIHDRDGDGVPDDIDVCPDVPDPDQADLDRDGVGDACDDDRDGDGIVNALDLCPDLDSRGMPDEDGDGIRDECDACPLDHDPDQANADLDRLGDACEDPDPTRFSRVAFLAPFASSIGDLTANPETNVTVAEGAARVESSDRTLLWRSEDSSFPSNYAVDVRATYRERVGDSDPRGAVGALTRWTHRPGVGYAHGLGTADDSYGIARLCPGATCPEALAGFPNLDLAPDTSFALRATAFGNAFALAITVAGDSRVRQATATHGEHATGGFGVLVEGARVEIHAIAVYAP